MRITEQSNFGIVRDNIQRSRGKLGELQQQASSMKKLNTPSDDPVGAAKLLEIRTSKVNNEQFANNAKLAESWLENADHALGELSEIVLRAKELALSQSSGASTSEASRFGVAEEVTQLFQQAVSIGNRRIGDRFIFGGYKTDKAPIDAQGKYLGDNGQQMIEIAKGVFISSNVPGVELFNTQPKNSDDYQRSSPPEVYNRAPASIQADGMEMPRNQNVNLFDEIQSLRIGLLTGDLETVRSTLERLDQLHGHLTANRSKIGSRIAGMQSATNANERSALTAAQLSTTIEDADMVQVMSDMAREETVFRSSLQSSQKLIQPTLLEFLR